MANDKGKKLGVLDKKPKELIFICKPEASCQGKGIFICKKLDDLREKLNSNLLEQKVQWDEYLK